MTQELLVIVLPLVIVLVVLGSGVARDKSLLIRLPLYLAAFCLSLYFSFWVWESLHYGMN